MRLLWKESGFELVGALCVAAFALGVTWTVLESLFGLSATVAGLLSGVAATGTLEMVSRRHYADELAEVPRRAAPPPQRVTSGDQARSAPAAARLEGSRQVRRATQPAVPAVATASGALAGTAPAAQRGDAARDDRAASPRGRHERKTRGPATVAGRRAAVTRRAA